MEKINGDANIVAVNESLKHGNAADFLLLLMTFIFFIFIFLFKRSKKIRLCFDS
jgi:hypothetical protein